MTDADRARYFAWILQKLCLPEDTRMFDGEGPTIAGTLHILCSHAHGYEAYIKSHRCDDKQGEIARLTVQVEELHGLIGDLLEGRGQPRLGAMLKEAERRTAKKCAKLARETGHLGTPMDVESAIRRRFNLSPLEEQQP